MRLCQGCCCTLVIAIVIPINATPQTDSKTSKVVVFVFATILKSLLANAILFKQALKAGIDLIALATMERLTAGVVFLLSQSMFFQQFKKAGAGKT